jgi:hypothetical protein
MGGRPWARKRAVSLMYVAHGSAKKPQRRCVKEFYAIGSGDENDFPIHPRSMGESLPICIGGI